MKTLLTGTLAALLAMSMLAPASAAPYRLFGDVDGALDQTSEGLSNLRAVDDWQKPLIGMLLPAIQKVREAAHRSTSACPSDPTVTGDNEGEVDMNCAAEQLSAMILDSQTGRDGSPGLLNLVLKATGGKHIKSAKLFVRKQGTEGAPGTEKMIIAILIGLTKELDDARITDARVREPLDAAIGIAEDIDPESTSGKKLPAGWDLTTASPR